MRKLSFLSIGAALLMATAAPALAHHPFAAEFDWKKPVTLTGTVTKFDWGNPHTYIYVDAKDENGRMANWKIEMGGPASLTRLGWKQNAIKAGDMVTVDAWQSKDGSKFGSAKSVRLTNGNELFAASSFFESQRRPTQTASQPKPGQQPAATTGTSGSKPTGTSGKPRY